MAHAVVCMVHDEAAARIIVERLREAGFLSGDISVLLPDTRGTSEFAYEHNTKAPEGAVTGGAAGGLLGGVAGWLVGVGTLAIPGLGPFVAAGPILAALSGAAAGAAVGGLAGALIGMGIPEIEAKRYESKLREGNVLVSVQVVDGEMCGRAKQIFEDAGADDIHSSADELGYDDDRREDARILRSDYPDRP
jgi:hypothetical protein